jgi:predicted transcriptional regulator
MSDDDDNDDTLSFAEFKKSREYLVQKGFLCQAGTQDGKPLYVITNKGCVALRAVRRGQRGVFDED